MQLNELKDSWQNARGIPRSENELLRMTRIAMHPSLKKLRFKLIAETIFLLIFLTIYYDWFDGDKKPFYANLVLIAGLVLYIANDVVGFIALANPVRGSNLKVSVSNYLKRIRQLSVFSIIFSISYSISLVVYFSSVIRFDREKKFILLFFTVVLVQLIYWSHRIWTRRIRELSAQALDFENDK